MYGFLLHKVSPIGLDIGHDSVKMVQLVFSRGRISVLAADKVAFDYSLRNGRNGQLAFASSAINSMLATGGFRGREVVSCLSNDDLRVKILRIDPVDTFEQGDEIPQETLARLGIDGAVNTVKYIAAGNIGYGGQKKQELIVFAAGNEAIGSHIEFLEKCGLSPVGIDSVPCALFRNFQRSLRRQNDKETVNVFVDIGSCYTTVVITQGRHIGFVRQIRGGGGEKIDAAISAKVQVNPEEAALLRTQIRTGASSETIDAQMQQIINDVTQEVIEELVSQISMCVRYYAVTFRGQRPAEMILSGGEVCDSRFAETCCRRLALPVTVAEPLKDFSAGSMETQRNGQDKFSELAVAAGSCLKGWKPAVVEETEYV
ncbi:MAG: pilus assembly protein PilM [Planctomycetota bacterium]